MRNSQTPPRIAPLRPLRFRAALAFQWVSGLLLIVSCAPQVRKRDWSVYDGPGAEHFHQEEIDALDFVDPIEPLNRTLTNFNDAVLLGVVEPISRGYRVIVPEPVRQAVTRFGKNLLYPRRVLANLFQGKFRKAGQETKRFLINTTVGGLGFFDVAASKYGIQTSEEDFGQVLAFAGWRPSRYLCLPFYGPSTGRDAVGLVPDNLTDPAFYFFPARLVMSFNEATDYVESHKRFTRTTYDSYALMRIYWLLNRDRYITNYEYEAATGPAVQTLQALFLTYHDETFPERIRTGRVPLAATGRDLPYSFVLQPRAAAPVVFILPGLGAHRESPHALALAEMVYREGFSVAIISSAFNWEFMERASTTAVPGHAPIDAHDVHAALDAVSHDLDRRYPDRIGSRLLLGYSMGAFHAFYIAVQEQQPESELIKFDRYVTLDSPIRLLRGAQQLDAYYNAPLAFPAVERPGRIKNILAKALELGRGELDPSAELPFTEVEAKFLIGLSFRMVLQSIIYETQKRHDFGVLRTKRTPFRRSAAYEEIFDYSFMEYMYAFVLPYYTKRDLSITSDRRLIELNDLRFFEDALRRSQKIRHVANADDFLLEPEDIDWLTETLGGKNVRFLPRGGHLGGLYKPEVQHEVLRALRDGHAGMPSDDPPSPTTH